LQKFDEEFWQKSLADPVFFASKFLQIEPHKGQVKWLHNSIKPENALHTGNRWGKSLVQAIKILHRCIFKIRNTKYHQTSKYEAINASITLDQAKIIFENVIRLVKGSPNLEEIITEIKFTPFPHIVFCNGAIFWARSTQRRGEYLGVRGTSGIRGQPGDNDETGRQSRDAGLFLHPQGEELVLPEML
jgi:hypothetical protein